MIDQPDYCLQKAKLLSEKKSLEEEIFNFSHKQNDWLAPFQNWLKDAQSLDKIASDSDLFCKKVCAKEIFGSHLLLGEKTIRPAEGGNPNSLANSLAKTGETAWACLRHAHSLVGSQPLSSILGRGGAPKPLNLARPNKSKRVSILTNPAYNNDSLITCFKLILPFDVLKYFSRRAASNFDLNAS